MTCRKADELMQDVLNGEVDEESADGLGDHLSDCERCADAWHAVWQVRSMLTECEPPDPGEPYFEQATTRIIDRIVGMQAQTAVAEEPPIISTTRYGPLSIRGVGAAFVFALGVFVGSLLPGPGQAGTTGGKAVRDVGWLPARALSPVPDDRTGFRGANCGHADGHCGGLSLADKPRTDTPRSPRRTVTDGAESVPCKPPPPMIRSPQPVMPN